MNNELLFALLSTRPEYAKPKKCRRELVGPIRAFLAERGDLGLLDPTAFVPAHVARLVVERNSARLALVDFCKRCGRCPLSRSAA